jgi:SAM-dependent methyltransferase
LTRKLDIGCGRKKKDGYLGIDVSPGAQPDIYANPEHGLPFQDNTFSEVWMSHVFEHLNDPVKVMDEIWRVCCDGARVEVRGPHFSMPSLIWGDPTHKRGLSLSTFRYFDGTWYGARSKYEVINCILKKGGTSRADYGGKVWYWPAVISNSILEKVVNTSPSWISRFERIGSRFIGFQEIQVILSVRKDIPAQDINLHQNGAPS